LIALIINIHTLGRMLPAQSPLELLRQGTHPSMNAIG
jgi:hypothetical protein